MEGWHCWPEAPDHRAYLRASHRHLFHVTVSLALAHDDREVELHDLMDYCKAHMPPGDYGRKSAEQLGLDLAEAVADRWPGRSIQVSVYEDGEVGAVVGR